MSISVILSIAQIVVATLLVAAVLLQQTGEGLGSAFGGGGASFRSKRGFEKTLFTTTIVLGVLFALTSLLALLIQ